MDGAEGLLRFVLGAGRVACWTGSRQHHNFGEFQVPRRTLDRYNVLYIARGRARWRIEGVGVEVSAGDLLVVCPGEEHDALPMTKRTTVGSLHLRMRLPGGREGLALVRPPRVMRVEAGSRLEGYLRGHLAEFDRGPEASRYELGWAHLVVQEMLVEADRRGVLGYGELDPLVPEMLVLLRERLAEPTTLGDLAVASGYSAQHLNRLFNRVLGVTPIKLLTRMRMDAAGEALRGTGRTVAAVAESVGYADPYHFSRVFSAHFGQSPTAYRSALDSEYPA
ncbi:MAG: AraC family transcriptional regulator [Planctomycetota bacterium]